MTPIRSAMSVVVAALLAASTPATGTDPDGAQTPRILPSVGRLHVPAIRYRKGYAQHYDEQCSATLIKAQNGAVESDLVLSAWHCVADYRDLSRPLHFVSAAGEQRRARILASGGSMYSDWLLLRLTGPLPFPVALSTDNTRLEGPLRMVGYPRSGTRDVPARQQSVRCHITGNDDRDQRSDCVLSKGASGGGVFDGSSAALVGVISRGDSATQSIFVPLARFEPRIRPFLGLRVPRTPNPARR